MTGLDSGPTNLGGSFWRSRIGRRLLLATLAFCSLMTVIVTGLNLSPMGAAFGHPPHHAAGILADEALKIFLIGAFFLLLFRRLLTTHPSDLASAMANGALDKRMAAILEGIPDPAWIKDDAGRFIAVNRPLAIALGLSDPAGIIGKTATDPSLPDMVRRSMEDDAEATEPGLGTHITERRVDINGGTRLIETVKTPLLDAEGAVAGTVCIARDITEPVESRRKLQSIIANLPGVAFRIHYPADAPPRIAFAEGRYAVANATDLPIDEFLRHVHPDDRTRLTQVPAALRVSGELIHLFRVADPDGSYRWMRCWERVVERDEDSMITEGITLDVTDEMAATLALEMSERRYRELVEALPIGVFTIDGAGNAVLFNDATTDVLGYQLVAGENPWLPGSWAFHTDGTAMSAEERPSLRALRENRPLRDIEMVVPRPDGTPVHLLVYPTPIRDAAGNATGVVTAMVDITGRKRMEDDLRRLSTRLENLIANLPGTLFRFHYPAHGLKRLEFIDGGGLASRRLSRDDFLALSPEELSATFDPEDRAYLYGELPGLLRHQDEIVTHLHRRVFADGRPAWLRSWERVVERDGDQFWTEGITLDVTDEMASKQALERLNRVLRSRGAGSKVLLHATDEAELLQRICAAIVTAGGYRMAWIGLAESDDGVRVAAWADGDDGDAARVASTRDETMERAIRTGRPYVSRDMAMPAHGYRSSLALPLTLGDRKDRDFEYGALAICATEPDAFCDEEIRLFMDMANDLSFGIAALRERRRREEIERHLNQAQKIEALGQMAGNIAHDFNNLLGAIQGFARFITEDTAPRTPPHLHATRILAAGRRGQALVGQILSFARRGDMKREHFALAELIDETAALIKASIPATTSLAIESGAGDAIVSGDRDQLVQALLNLAINAHDALDGRPGKVTLRSRRPPTNGPVFQPPGRNTGVETTVPFRTWRDRDDTYHAVAGTLDPRGTYVSLTIADDGCGMDGVLLAQMFTPFFTTKPKGHGTGLGLAVVHGTVLALGGAVMVDSRPGEGTAIELILPSLPHGTPLPTALDEIVSAAPPLHASGTILLVDDDTDFGQMLLAALERCGFDVAPCADPHEALTGVREHLDVWDALVTDQTMPGMTGLDLIREIKKLTPALPCILCTGNAETIDAARLRDAGAAAILHKPVDIDTLVAMLKRLVAKSAEA